MSAARKRERRAERERALSVASDLRRGRALVDVLQANGALDEVRRAAIHPGMRDVVAYVLVGEDETKVTFFDRARLATDPALPEPLTCIRSDRPGSWVVAYRESDNAYAQFRLRVYRLVQGGAA